MGSSEQGGVDSAAGSCGGEKSCSLLPLMLSFAGLMRGRRCLAELEVEVTEPETEGVGEGPAEEGRLPNFNEK